MSETPIQPFAVRVDPKCPPDMVYVMDGEVIVGALNLRNGVVLDTAAIRALLMNVPQQGTTTAESS